MYHERHEGGAGGARDPWKRLTRPRLRLPPDAAAALSCGASWLPKSIGGAVLVLVELAG